MLTFLSLVPPDPQTLNSIETSTQGVPPRPSKEWKRLGFQGEDPVTDIRGMGMLSIRLMIGMARSHPALHSSLVKRTGMDFAMKAGGYPFACAGAKP